MTPKELLVAARELISNRANWGAAHLRSPGGQYCAIGALYAADGKTGLNWIEKDIYPGSYSYERATDEEAALIREAYDVLAEAGAEVLVGTRFEGVLDNKEEAVWRVNDRLGYQRTLEMFDKAIAKAQA